MTAAVYCQIIKEGLAAQRARDNAEMTRLSASGIDQMECIRRILFPWKTPEQYRQLCAEYDRTFGGKRKVA